MRRPSAPIAALLVAGALLASAGLGSLSAAPRRPGIPAPQSVAVQSATAVCPTPVASASVTTTLTAAVAPASALGGPEGSDVAADGSEPATMRPLDPTVDTPTASISAPGLAAGIPVRGEAIGPVLVHGGGALAPGLAADQLTRGTAGVWRGLAATACQPPVSRAWFVGGGSGVGQRTQIFLANADDRQAVVDLALYGPDGAIQTPASRGLVVAPHSQRVIELSALAPAQRVVAIHLVSREGRVAPTVLDLDVDGLRPAGVEYLPQTIGARRIVIPTVYPGEGARQLMLLSPREDVTVEVRLLSEDGAFTPTELPSIELEAGKVARVDLTPASAKAAVGLVLRAPSRIVAGLRAVLPGAYSEQLAVAGTPALTGPAVLTGITAAPLTTAVALAAPAGAATVRIATYAASGTAPTPPTVQDVDVPAGSQVTVALAVPAGAPWSWAVLTPLTGSGPVHAVRLVTESTPAGPGASATPLTTQRAFATIPSARYRVGTG